MKLKCRTKVEDEKLIDDDNIIKEFLRKNFLKFYITIYKQSTSKSADEKYMLDIYLFKGNLLVFMDFARRFMDIIIN